MKSRSYSWLFSGALVAVALFAYNSPAKADEWNKRTVITFNKPVEIPGMVLPAGTYVMKLVDSPSNRDVVQIFNKKETHVYRTILAIPTYRMEATSKTVIQFEERLAGAPQAIKRWYYPGDLRGEEFLYHPARSVATAEETHNPPQPTQAVAQTAPAPQPVQQAASTPEPAPAQQNVEMAQANPAPATPPPAPPAKTLPKTASDLPLVGLAGLLLLAASILMSRLIPA